MLMYPGTGPQINVHTLIFFLLFLNQNVCCGYSKEPSQLDDSFEHPKHMLRFLGKEIIAILGLHFLLNWTYVSRRARLKFKSRSSSTVTSILSVSDRTR